VESWMMKPPNGVNMTLRVVDDKKEEKKESLYITFTDLYKFKQSWLEEKLHEGHRVFIMPKKGRALEVKLVDYK
jgi:hypothetical protein